MRRREFVAAAAAAPLFAASEKPAVLGGTPVRKNKFPAWPLFDEREDKALLGAVRSGKWGRVTGDRVAAFEEAYAELMGSKGCLAMSNGTSALMTSMSMLGIGPGDEVIVPPYTFVATINAVLALHAMPVFADSDPATFQMDVKTVEPLISERTAAILPVHTGGSAVDMDALMKAAGKRGIPVVEDACQAHLSEWRGKKLGTIGKVGCYSFQATKNLNSGEGGALLTDDADLLEQCYAFHNNSRARKHIGADQFRYTSRGLNLRMTEFQAALLLAQMTRLEEQSRKREENAAYLTRLLGDIPGIKPAKRLEGNTRCSYHLFLFRYDVRAFSGLGRSAFLKALAAEGIPCTSGYGPLNREPFIKNTLTARALKRVYSAADIARWEERNRCPQNDRLTSEAVWFLQNLLLGSTSDMEQVADAVRKIRTHAEELARRA